MRPCRFGAGPGGAYLGHVSGHDEHAGRPGRVDEPAVDRQKRAAGRGDHAGIALGVVLGAAVTWNLAANLWLPWALYVPVPLSARLQVQSPVLVGYPFPS